MGHQVVDAGVKANLIDQCDARVLGLLVQGAHLRRDIGGGDKMRAFGDRQLRQLHMPVAGQHGDHHIGGAQELREARIEKA